jgi:hypothetical protein
VVLVVVADVVRERVERAVVAVRLLVEAVPHVVLRDEVPRARVQAAREEAAHDQVRDRAPPERAHEERVERELEGQVERVPERGALRADEARAERVEEDLEGREEGLARDVVEQRELERGGQVRVDAVLAEVLVVLDVVRLARRQRRAWGDAAHAP